MERGTTSYRTKTRGRIGFTFSHRKLASCEEGAGTACTAAIYQLTAAREKGPVDVG